MGPPDDPRDPCMPGRVQDYMTRKVFSIRKDKRVLAVQEIMHWAHIRHVPVVDEGGKLAGMISHRDVLHAALSIAMRAPDVERKRHLQSIVILEVMKTEVVTIGPDAPVQEAAREMRARKIGCLPVVEGGRMIGIITEHDLLGIVEKA